MMINIDKTLEAIAKLKRIEPESELEKIVICNIINSHLINIHKTRANEAKNKLMNYESYEIHNMHDYLEQKLGKM